jgi:hypothetical protein
MVELLDEVGTLSDTVWNSGDMDNDVDIEKQGRRGSYYICHEILNCFRSKQEAKKYIEDNNLTDVYVIRGKAKKLEITQSVNVTIK